ncbi:MAG: carbohydrate binding family 9 domain-containing protein [Gemmatimonadota bacterium]|nr:MAG: carbohydrate binding family 9 domain-containing protein [Gemmatimonadota bacterium]
MTVGQALPRRATLAFVFVVCPAAVNGWQQGALQGGGAYPIDVEAAPRPATEAVYATSAVRVDGRLDEAAWRAAQSVSGFTQSQPDAGYPATERTEVRILYDADRLYVGALCYDSEPDKLVITTLEYGLGPSTHDMDVFAITLDTFLDRQNAFIWLVNPYGAYRDGQVFNDSRSADYAWRGVVDIKTEVHDSGYTVEMGIPWTTLRFDRTRGEQQWGMQLMRRVRRKREDSYWAPVDRRDLVHRMSKAGTLNGLRDVSPGRNLKIKPFVFATSLSGSLHPTGASNDEGLDAGLDVKYGLTSGLTLDLTYNTDFSQAEVDQQRVNLTRFPLFFPEQREFFVENSGSFVLGDVTERNYRMGSSLRDFTLFHSRRIGLSGGRPIPIFAGGRVTGRAGDFELGLLNVQTEAVEPASPLDPSTRTPAENFTVVRVRRSFGGSDAGGMFLNRQATGSSADGEFNRSYGFDVNLHLLDHMIVNSYLVGSDEPGAADASQLAGRVSVAWRDQLWDASGFVKQVGAAFNPGVGFVRRRGIRHAYATAGAHPQPKVPLVQEMNPFGEIHHLTDSNRELLTREATVGLGVIFLDGSNASLSYSNRFERLDEPFSVDPDGRVVFPAGDYGFHEARVSFRSSAAKPLNFSADVTAGGFYSGSRISIGAAAQWRPSYRLSFRFSASHDDVSGEGGSFTAVVLRSRVQFAASTKLFGSGDVQYNSQTDELIANVRVNLMYAPLSDVFLVYTERRDTGENLVLERSVTAKVTKMFAF